MWKYVYLVLMLIVIYFIQRVLIALRCKSYDELYKVLYIQNNPQLYLKLLENQKLKLLFKKSAILVFELDAYLMMGEDKKCENLFDRLNHISLTKTEKIEINQKKLSYYCSKGYNIKAIQSIKIIENLIKNNADKNYNEILADNHIIYRVYIDHDFTLIPHLIELQENQIGIQKGITLYRIAKLFFFQNCNNKPSTI